MPFFVAIIGGLVAHWLTIWRDRRNKRKEQRIQYLIEAYRRLSKASHHPRLYEIAEEVQSAVNDIQLFGTEKQIRLAEKFAFDLANNKVAQADELFGELRDDLRSELKLPKTPSKFFSLRIQPEEKGKKSINQMRR